MCSALPFRQRSFIYREPQRHALAGQAHVPPTFEKPFRERLRGAVGVVPEELYNARQIADGGYPLALFPPTQCKHVHL